MNFCPDCGIPKPSDTHTCKEYEQNIDLTPDQDRLRSASLLAVLGLPDTALVSAPTKDNKVSYAFMVGSDYSPCFDPAGLTP